MNGLTTLRTDLNAALRDLRRCPALASSTLLLLALGVGVNIACFALLGSFERLLGVETSLRPAGTWIAPLLLGVLALASLVAGSSGSRRRLNHMLVAEAIAVVAALGVLTTMAASMAPALISRLQ